MVLRRRLAGSGAGKTGSGQSVNSIELFRLKRLKLSAQRNETETKQFKNSLETVLTLFCFSFISMCGQL